MKHLPRFGSSQLRNNLRNPNLKYMHVGLIQQELETLELIFMNVNPLNIHLLEIRCHKTHQTNTTLFIQ